MIDRIRHYDRPLTRGERALLAVIVVIGYFAVGVFACTFTSRVEVFAWGTGAGVVLALVSDWAGALGG